ncbi:UNVERIFIED_CONTAM: hypothetical protein HDU68_005764 [Siphonaria sp. JEL0065]|nr:hypothetical protein HDU68_005764 [Siphonaria sp. JEL0065]
MDSEKPAAVCQLHEIDDKKRKVEDDKDEDDDELSDSEWSSDTANETETFSDDEQVVELKRKILELMEKEVYSSMVLLGRLVSLKEENQTLKTVITANNKRRKLDDLPST